MKTWIVCYFGAGIGWIGAYWPAGLEDKAFFPKVKLKVKLLSRVRLCATPWTVAYQALRSFSVYGIFQARVGCHFLLQGIFPTQGSNPGLLHCRQMLYRLSHQGSLQLKERAIEIVAFGRER